MANNGNEAFYKRLTRLFRSGPAIRRKIRAQDYKNYYDSQVVQNNLGYYGAAAFKREASPYSTVGSYGMLDRMSRYAEFTEMESTPEVATALNVYADESCATDENGNVFHVYSENKQVQSALEELFFDVLNIEFNGRRMVRNLTKNGDFFAYIEVVPEYGVINVEPLPVNEVEREEGFDKHDPYAVRFKLLSRGNKYLENWQMLHMRILGNDLFIPYGTSILEAARRPWRQLLMMEDAMLVYRLVRSPERRVFYIDVSAIEPSAVGSYMNQVKQSLKGNSVIEQLTGREDFRYNPQSVEDDFFLPTRPNNQTKIESLPGGQNATAVEDVEYIQRKLFAALMVPKAYLTYDEAISSKATLAQEDIRFSRTIATLQKIVVAELNKLAMIHLYALGFEGEDLVDFELSFSNPSTVAVQQKLALIASKLDIAGKAWELAKETGFYSMNYISREILGLRPDEINQVKYEARQDQAWLAELKKLAENPPFDRSIDSNVDIFDKSNYKVPTSPFAPDPKELQDLERSTGEEELALRKARAAEKEAEAQASGGLTRDSMAAPIRHSPTPKRGRSKAFTGNRALSTPDFKSMLDITKNRYSKDPYDTASAATNLKRFVLEKRIEQDLLMEGIPYGLPKELQSAMRSMHRQLIQPTRSAILENIEVDTNEEEARSTVFTEASLSSSLGIDKDK